MSTGQEQSGYSKTPLVKKLGLKADSKACFLNPPANYLELLGPIPPGVAIFHSLEGSFDFIHFFTTGKDEVFELVPALKESLDYKGMLWISWPKRASKVITDLDENIIRDCGLHFGLVDVKVCAIDQIWSGLKFVYRTKDRPVNS
ncbi:MAG TPA: DUF3052 domain-containing protein [Chloroflexia bacterium]|nr:DUF3052 domain-containing protein [Chloroflexia bacterium]